jgi:Acyl-coenzyme A synthetases/AMP-(fatty) acid ligases
VSDDHPIWAPSAERIARANLTRFLDTLRASGLPVADYAALREWSVNQPERFWPHVWRFTGVIGDPGDRVGTGLGRMAPPDPTLGPRWFPHGRLNFAENLLRHGGSRTALSFSNELGHQRSLSRDELRHAVAGFAAGLQSAGIGVGDRVAGFLPNMPEAVIAMLAAASVGAVWSSCSPDFGARGVLDRFGQIRPRLLVAADGYRYAGKEIDSLQRIREVREQIPEIERVVVVPYRSTDPAIDGIAGAVRWDDFVEEASGPPAFEQLPFDHPLFVMYSSGTTGLPKCMVHGAGRHAAAAPEGAGAAHRPHRR